MTDQNQLTNLLFSNNILQAEFLQMQMRREWQNSLAEPRNQQPGRLLQHGYKVYSQNDEDGIIAEIVNRLGDKCPKTFIEFGVESGIECNTLRLLLDGWKGLWLDGSDRYVAAINQNMASYVQSGALKAALAFITKDNINQIFEQNGFTGEIGLLSIDIDSNDIWVWKAVDVVKPAIVAIEYNATWVPPLSIAQPDDPKVTWTGNNYFGASLKALEKVGKEKGYNLVGCSFAGVNAFFVRADLCGDKFHAPFTAEEHFEPSRYWMRLLRAGHRPGIGPVVTV